MGGTNLESETQTLPLRAVMAYEGVQLEHDTFSCSICLDLLKVPVTIPCGHSYCLSCIKNFWNGEEQRERSYSCPQCRQAFTSRPVLVKNTMLAVLVEQLKKTGVHSAAAGPCYAGDEDVACDVCTGRKQKAVKSCLQCLISYCENHLQPHFNVARLKKHKVVDVSKTLQEYVCPRHDEVMTMFCRSDQQIICYLCSVEEHKGHDTVSAAAERAERQREFEASRQNIQQRISDREKDVKLLQQEVVAVSRSADKAVEDSEKTFTRLIHLLQERSRNVKEQIRSQQEAEVSRVKDVEEKLQQEISELKRKDAEMELLSHTDDHNQFLQNYASLSQLSEATSSIQTRPLRYFQDTTAAVLELRNQLQAVLRDAGTHISLTEVDALLPPPEPKTRDGFLKYSCGITLDPKTANKELLLSEENRKATVKDSKAKSCWYTGCWCQVLSRESLTGRCYWEVELEGRGVYVVVSYKNLSSAGDAYQCTFGHNETSWMLDCDSNRYTFWFNNVSTRVSGPRSSRVGVYLDHAAGVLSFYSVSDTMTLLHRVHTTFTQPPYAGLRLCSYEATAKICKLK